MKQCPNCGAKKTRCPECGKEYQHGKQSHCDEIFCKAMNAPLDCVGCDFVVEKNLKGVLNFDMELIPYR